MLKKVILSFINDTAIQKHCCVAKREHDQRGNQNCNGLEEQSLSVTLENHAMVVIHESQEFKRNTADRYCYHNRC